jgi:hypothetical protein
MSKDPPNKPTSWRKVHRVLSWSGASSAELHHLVASVTDSGNAVMFSRTIDGSALVLAIYSGNEKAKEYITDPGDIPPLFEWVIGEYS